MCPRYQWDEVVYQFLGSSDHPVAQIFASRLKSGRIFGDFSIQMTENTRKRPNFVASYLGNRRELRVK